MNILTDIHNIISSVVIVEEKLNEKINNKPEDFTSFEVFATSAVIPSGYADTNERSVTSSVANLFNFDNVTGTGLTYLR